MWPFKQSPLAQDAAAMVEELEEVSAKHQTAYVKLVKTIARGVDVLAEVPIEEGAERIFGPRGD